MTRINTAIETEVSMMKDVQVGLGSRDEGSELALILRLDLLDGEDGSSLLVNDCAETGLALDDDVGNAHLAAESGEEDDELDRVDVVGDDNESGLLGFDKGDTVVETVLGEKGLLVLHDPTRMSMNSDEREIRGRRRRTFCASLPSAASLAAASRRAFFSWLVSGRYLLRSLKSWVAVFLSRVWENWAMAGGTFRRWARMTFWRWRRTYSGHFTKRVRSVLGLMS